MSKSYSEIEQSVKDQIETFKPLLSNVNSLVDIGTGISLHVHVLAKYFPNIAFETIDVSDSRIRKELPFQLYDGITLPYQENQFDISLLDEVLHHCKDPLHLLDESMRVSGKVYIVEHFALHEGDPSLREQEIKKLTELDIIHHCETYAPFTEKSLSTLINKLGFDHQVMDLAYKGKREITKKLYIINKNNKV